MNELRIFENEKFGSIRTITIDNEPWFVASDICKVLDLSNPTMAVQRLEEDEKAKFNLGLSGGNTNCVNEYGLYNLILASRKQEAKDFKRWITHEVIPSIRENGGYIAGQETLSDDELLEKAVLVAQRKIAERDKIIAKQKERIEQDKPKVIFANAVSASENSILVRDLAKIIRQNGISIGEKRLYKWLRGNGYICQSSTEPTQKAMELGLFERIVRTVDRGNGLPIETITTKVTGKGQVYFVNKFIENEEIAIK